MTITKRAATTTLEHQDAAQVNRVESALDIFLYRDYRPGQPLTYELSVYGTVGDAVFEELIARYTEAGWTVVRDGTKLTFS